MGKPKPVSKKLIEQIEQVESDRDFEPIERDKPIEFENVLSTGSTLLDLAISGERVRGGGLPGGVLIEVYGPEQTGKTALLAEVLSAAEKKKPPGKTFVDDPEGRFDQEMRRIYRMKMPTKNYDRSDTVTHLFANLESFAKGIGITLTDGDEREKGRGKGKKDTTPKTKYGISVMGADSLAALSTKMEMEGEDKMGMRRAKEFSQMLRKYTRLIHKGGLIMMCTNQVRDSDTGPVTPGGRAVRFYSDIRIELRRGYSVGGAYKTSIKRTANIDKGNGKVSIEQQVGIITGAKVVKTVGPPFRTAPVYIEFGYGVDDIRANLQWFKDMRKDSSYGFDKITAVSLEMAIWKIEGSPNEYGEPSEEPQHAQLRDRVIDLWEEIQAEFKITRAEKTR